MASLRFIGATRQVTGSCYLLETDSKKILLECGMYQGNGHAERLNKQPFPFRPEEIDAVIISHTHLDHCGRTPKLVKDGYQGPIYMTAATHDLIEVMLRDAAFLEMKDNERENERRQRSGKPPVEPLFTDADVDKVLNMRHIGHYGKSVSITPDITLTFFDAGHILGSAIVQLQIKENNKTRTLVFSGDLGNSHTALLNDPDIVKQADVLLLESTYGDRNHRPLTETLDEFRQALRDASENGGNVLIPAFTIGRTQEILFWLGKFYREGSLQQQYVFLDSPMAIAATNIYYQHMHSFTDDDTHAFRNTVKSSWKEWLPILRPTRTTAESIAINNISGGAIIIAGSGMCTGGRIRHHLKNNLWRNNAHVIIVGFQAEQTPGRALVDGTKRLSIFGKDVTVKAAVHTLGAFSAHADQSQLLAWASHFQPKRPELYLIHGELEKMLELQKQFHEQQDWHANIPSPDESIAF